MKKKILTYLTLTTMIMTADLNSQVINNLDPLNSVTQEIDYKENETAALLAKLNSSEKEINIDCWRKDIENSFDIDEFLKWVAANNIKNNWVDEGDIIKNHYLYTNPETGLLNWIPWDNSSINYKGINVSWDIIKNLISDDQFKNTYDTYLREFIDELYFLK